MKGLAPTPTLGRAWLIAVQMACAAFFVLDALGDWVGIGLGSFDLHMLVEMAATASLIVAIALEWRLLGQFLHREAHMLQGLSVAARALHDRLEELFDTCRLTPAERDVATFLVKGADIAEIARLRGSAEGTIKAHLNAICRKAGVTGRPGLLSLLVEDLLVEPVRRRTRLS